MAEDRLVALEDADGGRLAVARGAVALAAPARDSRTGERAEGSWVLLPYATAVRCEAERLFKLFGLKQLTQASGEPVGVAPEAVLRVGRPQGGTTDSVVEFRVAGVKPVMVRETVDEVVAALNR